MDRWYLPGFDEKMITAFLEPKIKIVPK